MLVLTRKRNDEIVVDNQITIRVLQITGNRIRLGIDAPSATTIRRGELQPLDDLERPSSSMHECNPDVQ